MRSPGCGLPETSNTLQLVAHAFDVDDGAIAVGGELIFDRRDFQLDYVRPGMVDRRLDLDPLADLGVDFRDRLAVAPHCELYRLAAVGAVEDARDDDLVLADDAVPWRFDQFDAPLTLALVAGDQRVQRGVEAERGRRLGNVVHVAIGDHDRAADPLRRRVGERAPQRGEQFGALGFGFLARRFDDAQINVPESFQPRLDLVAGFVGLLRPLANVLAAGTVDDQGDNVLERAAVLLDEIGIAKAEQQ